MTQIHLLNAILQGFPSLWRTLLARPQGVMWPRGAVFGTWQLRCTATTCHCIANKATVCSQLASLCTQPSRLPLPGQCKWETPFISGYQWTLDNVILFQPPESSHTFLRQDLLVSFHIQWNRDCIQLCCLLLHRVELALQLSLSPTLFTPTPRVIAPQNNAHSHSGIIRITGGDLPLHSVLLKRLGIGKKKT